MKEIQLRDVQESDLPAFFKMQSDPVANQMAAFTAKDPTDRDAFTAHWAKLLRDETVVKMAIVVDGVVVGNICSFELRGEREICYWIEREEWGKGIASRALSLFLATLSHRPLHARAARDNMGSIRVLEKSGFVVTGYEKGFANARGMEIEEVVLVLR